MKVAHYSLVFFFILSVCTTACVKTPTTSENLNVETHIEDKQPVTAKTDSVYPVLDLEAEKMCSAYLARNFDEYADYLYPRFIEAEGRGKNNFVESLNRKLNETEIVDCKVKNSIQVIESANKIFVALPIEREMKSSRGTTTEKSNFLAISEDNGASWKFVNADAEARIKFLFPEFVSKFDSSIYGLKLSINMTS